MVSVQTPGVTLNLPQAVGQWFSMTPGASTPSTGEAGMTIDTTKITPEKLAEMNASLMVDNNYLRGRIKELEAWEQGKRVH